MKEVTKIVVSGEQGFNLAAKAFLLFDRRFHRLRHQIGKGGFFEVFLTIFR
jgi:hypothetical protein